MILGYDALQGSVLDSCSPLRHGGMDVWALTFKHRCHEEFRKESDLPDSKLSLHFLFQRDEGLSLQGMRAHISFLATCSPSHDSQVTWRGSCILHPCIRTLPTRKWRRSGTRGSSHPEEEERSETLLRPGSQSFDSPQWPWWILQESSGFHQRSFNLYWRLDRHPFVVVEPGSLGSGCC